MDTFTIKNSSQIKTRKEMEKLIKYYRLIEPDNQALQRSINSLIREWCGHNLLFDLGLFHSHTQDVDFESNPKWYFSVIWFVLSLFYWK